MGRRRINIRSQNRIDGSYQDDRVAKRSQVDEISGVAAGVREFQLERYKYVLQQIHTVNENVYRFLAIYQALAVTLVSGSLTIFVGYRRWNIPAPVARSGVVGLLILLSVVAAFTALLITVGVFSWLDYRREECELTDIMVHPGFRKPPTARNFARWYETYILFFIIGSTAFLWICASVYILPDMH